uniref:Fungal lipase-like domain-containing protein n=1 Tax=Acrobeloides nanus TaxID=290746 RepID=A0A914CCW1_9BILA
MASLSAGYIAFMGYFPASQIKLVTYGQPRVGDLAYANYIDSTIPFAYRVVHKDDMVPHLPPIWLEMGDWSNYTHHKSEIWYNNNMAVGQPYVECDVNESNQCSNQLEGNLFDLSTIDHDYYFNISVGFSVDGCPNYNPGGRASHVGETRHKFMLKH